MNENEISFAVRGIAFDIYNEMGPGLFESVYETIMANELESRGFHVDRQLGVPLIFKDKKFDIGFRLDLLINDCVIVEIKSIDNLGEVHFKQLLTYLRLMDKKLGLLINFNTSNLKDSIQRIVNNL